jgi:hypothetical protein
MKTLSGSRHISSVFELTGFSKTRSPRRKKAPALIRANLLLILVLIPMHSIAQDDTLRQTIAGTVRGQIDENSALSWRGIPYAQPPVGELRWKAPRPPERFAGTLDARQFSPICTQLGHPLLDIDPSLYGKAVGSEDCLYVNVWAPPVPKNTDGDTRRLPVMVWEAAISIMVAISPSNRRSLSSRSITALDCLAGSAIRHYARPLQRMWTEVPTSARWILSRH